MYVLNFRQPLPWGCGFIKWQFSLWTVKWPKYQQAIFWAASLHFAFADSFYHHSYPVHYFLPLSVLVSVSRVKTKGQNRNHLRRLGVGTTLSLFTSEYVSARNSYKILFFTTLLWNATISTERSHPSPHQKTHTHTHTQKVSKYVVTLLQSYGSKNVGSGRVCVSVTWDPNIVLRDVNTLDTISDRTADNTRIGYCVWKRWNTWPIDNAWHSNHVLYATQCHPPCSCCLYGTNLIVLLMSKSI